MQNTWQECRGDGFKIPLASLKHRPWLINVRDGVKPAHGVFIGTDKPGDGRGRGRGRGMSGHLHAGWMASKWCDLTCKGEAACFPGPVAHTHGGRGKKMRERVYNEQGSDAFANVRLT